MYMTLLQWISYRHFSDVTLQEVVWEVIDAFLFLSCEDFYGFVSLKCFLLNRLNAAEFLNVHLVFWGVVLQLLHSRDVTWPLCAFQSVCGASAVHLLTDCSHRAAAAARLRSASRGSAAFGAEVGRMEEKQRRWTLHRGIPIYDVVKQASEHRVFTPIILGHWQANKTG